MEQQSPTMSRSKILEFSVGIIAESSNKKVTESLLIAWKIGLDGVPDNYIQKGVRILIQEKKDSYMPAPGELREICRVLRKNEVSIKKIDASNNEKIDYDSVLLISEKSSSLAKDLSSHTSTKNKSTTKPKIIIYDFIDHVGGLVRGEAKGHHELNFFEDQCLIRFRKRPHTSKQLYSVFKQIVKKDINGIIINSFWAYVKCSQNTNSAEPITIGYF